VAAAPREGPPNEVLHARVIAFLALTRKRAEIKAAKQVPRGILDTIGIAPVNDGDGGQFAKAFAGRQGP
jgi:hypothetical protein